MKEMNNLGEFLSSYRISTSAMEIMEILDRSHALEQSILWQSFDTHRSLFKILSIDIEQSSKRLTVRYENVESLINPEAPVFIKVPFRDTIFKGKVSQFNKNEVVINFPKEVRFREFRETLRTSFHQGERFAYVRPSLTNISSEKISTLKVHLKDVSQKGIGLIISENNTHLVKPGNFIELMALHDHDLHSPILGRVVYSKKMKKLDSNRRPYYRIGVKMMAPIPDNVLKKIGPAHKLGLKSQDLLESDLLSEDFKELLNSEIHRTLGKMKKRPAILKYLSQLEVIRGDDDYLHEHIKILSIFCTFIARSMNWVSDASLEKFIYASYLHDAPLFAFPRVARIKDLSDYERYKEQLSPEEQKAFLSAPETAYQLSKSDESAPPDVDQMLLMQKELPNGLGFQKKTHSRISPMAAVFIVAHDITDSVMKDPDWSFDPWIYEAKRTFKGGHFNKIIESIESSKVSLKRIKV